MGSFPFWSVTSCHFPCLDFDCNKMVVDFGEKLMHNKERNFKKDGLNRRLKFVNIYTFVNVYTCKRVHGPSSSTSNKLLLYYAICTQVRNQSVLKNALFFHKPRWVQVPISACLLRQEGDFLAKIDFLWHFLVKNFKIKALIKKNEKHLLDISFEMIFMQSYHF